MKNISTISSIVSSAIGILGIIASLAYSHYLVFHLEYMEKKLLPIKTKANLALSTVGLTLLAVLMLSTVIFLTKSKFITYVLIIYLGLIALFYIANEHQNKKTLIKFDYIGKTYVFINRIDDTTISALPEDKYKEKDKDNTSIILISLSKLSDVEFYTDNKKQKSPTNNQDNTLSSNTISQLLILKELLDKNIISQEEFVAKKKQLLNL